MRHLGLQVSELLAYDPKVRLEEFDAVHKMRVASRRLRSILASARPLLDREHTDPIRDELRWLSEVLGEVRDAEVLHERFTQRLASLPIAPAEEPAWLAAVKSRETEGYVNIREALSGDRYFALLNALDRLLQAPPLTKRAGRAAGKELPRLVRRSWSRLERTQAQITEAPSPELRDEARHETRKAAKRARYTADATREVLGDDAKTVSKAAKSLQEVLGRFQDGVIAQEMLRGITPAGTDDAFLLGALYGLERCEAETALAEADSTWADAQSTARPLLH